MNRQKAYKKAVEFMNSKIEGHTVELEELPSMEYFKVFFESDHILNPEVFSYKDKPMDKQTAEDFFTFAKNRLECQCCPQNDECGKTPNACKENLYKAAQAICSDNIMDNLAPGDILKVTSDKKLEVIKSKKLQIGEVISNHSDESEMTIEQAKQFLKYSDGRMNCIECPLECTVCKDIYDCQKLLNQASRLLYNKEKPLTTYSAEPEQTEEPMTLTVHPYSKKPVKGDLLIINKAYFKVFSGKFSKINNPLVYSAIDSSKTTEVLQPWKNTGINIPVKPYTRIKPK